MRWMIKLSELFSVSYGNKFDLNKMKVHDENTDIKFVSRTSQNLGVIASVEKFNGVEPYPAGLITVALGGAMLSSFVQPRPFYTAQNIVVLTPKKQMSFQEKVFYCLCISKNKWKYSTFGREANRTIKDLDLPDKISKWVGHIKEDDTDLSKPFIEKEIPLYDRRWAWFKYEDLFSIERGRGARKDKMSFEGQTPVITSVDKNNGLIGRIDAPPVHKGNVIGVNRNGSVGEAFYQPVAFSSTEDVHVFNPKFKLTPYSALFLVTLIRRERYKYNYARKWSITRMNETRLKLPVDKDGNPDWQFMENYIKTLRYSGGINN